jgi:hypothetical protein
MNSIPQILPLGFRQQLGAAKPKDLSHHHQ